MPSLDWDPLAATNAVELLSKLIGASRDQLDGLEIEAWEAKLPFYEDTNLLRWKVKIAGDAKARVVPDVYALQTTKTLRALDGSSAPIHEANAVESLDLSPEHILDYLRFFLFAVRSSDDAFVLVEPPSNGPSPVSPEVRPILSEANVDAAGRHVFHAYVAYKGLLFRATFAIADHGEVEMVDDQPVSTDVPPEALPTVEPLEGIANVKRLVMTTNKSVLRILVEILLEKALAATASHRLMETFAHSTRAARPLAQFSALVLNTFPVVIIESAIPFVEETIAEIVQSYAETSRVLPTCKVTPVPPEEVTVTVTLPESGPALVTLPMQTYRSVTDVNRLAYELSCKDYAALIACERATQLPEVLRGIRDLVLRLPPLGLDGFAELFRSAMGADLPEGWAADGASWTKYVSHTDFEHPRRFRLGNDKAVAYIRSRVEERMAAVDVERAVALSELYGMPEARSFAEDLISDLHAAINGQLPWSQVDRGALIVGAPGTGKTTLARAIAKECGVRFIAASAAGWQSSGEHLGHHIRAIRASFSEARQYAPSILFIDEVDSLGNRETFRGQNAQYLTEVVNAVLEQMQELDPAAPVFVLAATNHEDNIDPALKRSGRLDRVIHIPRPNSDALKLIYDYHLRALLKGADLATDVDTRILGGLSLGFTGADVQRVVRGAARRARRRKQTLSQTDLIAEITNKPRDGEGVRLGLSEIRRVSIHEAGHALAMYLNDQSQVRITFVTVVPRADGTLGFVARMPDDRLSLTRADYLRELEVALAGRAAEELQDGRDGLTGGASSDLRVATQLAERMVTQLALGSADRLRWSDELSSEALSMVDGLLREAYESVKQKLARNEASLRLLADTLGTRQELTGEEVYSLLSAPAPAPAKLAGARDGTR